MASRSHCMQRFEGVNRIINGNKWGDRLQNVVLATNVRYIPGSCQIQIQIAICHGAPVALPPALCRGLGPARRAARPRARGRDGWAAGVAGEAGGASAPGAARRVGRASRGQCSSARHTATSGSRARPPRSGPARGCSCRACSATGALPCPCTTRRARGAGGGAASRREVSEPTAPARSYTRRSSERTRVTG